MEPRELPQSAREALGWAEDASHTHTMRPGMYTGIAATAKYPKAFKRFYVGADSAFEAEAKVRKAHELLWGKDAADAVRIEQVELWNNIAWQP